MNAPARNLARHSGKPAQFAPDPGRRALIAKVKIAQKQLGLDEDTYRGAMLEATGKMSAGDCSIEELKRAVAHFAARGFKPTTTARGGKSARADSPMARKARAMWISLHHLGAIDNPDEKALEAFARRQMNCEKMQWADQSKAYLLVEALKAIAERHGWRQRVDHLQKEYQLHALKANLCAAILAKLIDKGLVPANWSLGEAAYRLTGEGDPNVSIYPIEQLETIAAALGAKLREAGQ